MRWDTETRLVATEAGLGSTISVRIDDRLISIRLWSIRDSSIRDADRSGPSFSPKLKVSDAGVGGMLYWPELSLGPSISAIVRPKPTSSFQTSRNRTPLVTILKALRSISSRMASTSSSDGSPFAISWNFFAVFTSEDRSDSKAFRILRSPSNRLTRADSRVRHSDFSCGMISPVIVSRF